MVDQRARDIGVTVDDNTLKQDDVIVVDQADAVAGATAQMSVEDLDKYTNKSNLSRLRCSLTKDSNDNIVLTTRYFSQKNTIVSLDEDIEFYTRAQLPNDWQNKTAPTITIDGQGSYPIYNEGLVNTKGANLTLDRNTVASGLNYWYWDSVLQAVFYRHSVYASGTFHTVTDVVDSGYLAGFLTLNGSVNQITDFLRTNFPNVPDWAFSGNATQDTRGRTIIKAGGSYVGGTITDGKSEQFTFTSKWGYGNVDPHFGDTSSNLTVEDASGAQLNLTVGGATLKGNKVTLNKGNKRNEASSVAIAVQLKL